MPILNGRKVLIVEDRYLVANDVAEEVRRLGGEVVGPCPTIAAADALIAHSRVDVALLDVNLNGDWVYPLADRLERAGVPIVFLTGYDAPQITDPWRSRPRVEKPVSAGALRAELAKLL